mmetsp:Transcript_30684/g.77561  ORF Transcript_30684/g.77561 Transcript_30684/m.77561 type:complete len:332 (-) Transcript_30684:479-1474(-)
MTMVIAAFGYVVGQQVDIYSATQGGWVPGTVISIIGTPGSVTVKYNDRLMQKTLPLELLSSIRPKVVQPCSAVGQRVEAPSKIYDKSVPGIAVCTTKDPLIGVGARHDAGGLQKILPTDQLCSVRPLPVSAAPQPVVDSVVFLDVDGVLHSLYGEEIFADSCCAALESILRGSGARVVLTNSWSREGGDRITMVDGLLQQRGLHGLYDRTTPPRSRPEEEICEWLDRHPEVMRWVALDDNDLEVGQSAAANRLRGFCVRPDKHVGLTARDARRALSLLGAVAHGDAEEVMLSAEEKQRAAQSQAAEAQTWEELRNGDLAQMEAQFFGDDSP